MIQTTFFVSEKINKKQVTSSDLCMPERKRPLIKQNNEAALEKLRSHAMGFNFENKTKYKQLCDWYIIKTQNGMNVFECVWEGDVYVINF